MSLKKNSTSGGESVRTEEFLFDIGNRREQRGHVDSTVDSQQVITFPEPFKEGTFPNVLISLSLDGGAGGITVAQVNQDPALRHLQFIADRNNDAANTDNPVIHWVAIGVKP